MKTREIVYLDEVEVLEAINFWYKTKSNKETELIYADEEFSLTRYGKLFNDPSVKGELKFYIKNLGLAPNDI